MRRSRRLPIFVTRITLRQIQYQLPPTPPVAQKAIIAAGAGDSSKTATEIDRRRKRERERKQQSEGTERGVHSG
eukprot:3158587-Rhodomonas_salina.3